MSNDEMKPNRFLQWHKAREQYSFIMNALNSGKRIMTGSYTRPTIYDARHIEMFKCGKSACYVRRGKNNWDSLQFTPIKIMD